MFFNLTLEYDNMHRITSKRQTLSRNDIQFDGTLNVGYNLAYTYYTKFQLPYNGLNNDNIIPGFQPALMSLASTASNTDNYEEYSYYIHSDHLGSTSYITDSDGEVSQHVEYVPFGEVFIEELSSSAKLNTPFLFNGKELDEETGLYYYGARYYNPRLSLWLSTDPLELFAPNITPYRYGFNNPVNFIDRNGLFESEEEAKNWAEKNKIDVGLFRAHRIMKENENSWSVVNAREGIMYNRDKSLNGIDNVIGLMPDGVTKSVIVFDKPYNEFNTFISDCWNSTFARNIIPDFISVGFGFSGIAGVGGSSNIELNWLIRGQEASWYPIVSVTQTVGTGFSVDATINIGGANYIGETYNIKRDLVQTSIGNGNVGGVISVGASAGAKIGFTGGISSVTEATVVSRQVNIGVGLPTGPAPINGAIGASNTYILKDFAK